MNIMFNLSPTVMQQVSFFHLEKWISYSFAQEGFVVCFSFLSSRDNSKNTPHIPYLNESFTQEDVLWVWWSQLWISGIKVIQYGRHIKFYVKYTLDAFLWGVNISINFYSFFFYWKVWSWKKLVDEFSILFWLLLLVFYNKKRDTVKCKTRNICQCCLSQVLS